MKLKTNRLILDPLKMADLEIFHLSNIDPIVRKFLWDNEVIPTSLSKEILEEVEQAFQKENWGLWKVIDHHFGTYMGYVGLWKFFNEKQPQLIFALLPQFTGFGYAVEASEEVIRYAFENLQFEYLIASTDLPNVRSIGVCSRLGMVLKDEKEMDGKPTLFFELKKPTSNTIKE